MTDDEFMEMLGAIVLFWPNQELSAENAAYWRKRLTQFDHDVVMGTLELLHDQSEFLPHLSLVITTCVDGTRRKRLRARPPARELPARSNFGPRCRACPAVLITSFDGASDTCRNCVKTT